MVTTNPKYHFENDITKGGRTNNIERCKFSFCFVNEHSEFGRIRENHDFKSLWIEKKAVWVKRRQKHIRSDPCGTDFECALDRMGERTKEGVFFMEEGLKLFRVQVPVRNLFGIMDK